MTAAVYLAQSDSPTKMFKSDQFLAENSQTAKAETTSNANHHQNRTKKSQSKAKTSATTSNQPIATPAANCPKTITKQATILRDPTISAKAPSQTPTRISPQQTKPFPINQSDLTSPSLASSENNNNNTPTSSDQQIQLSSQLIKSQTNPTSTTTTTSIASSSSIDIKPALVASKLIAPEIKSPDHNESGQNQSSQSTRPSDEAAARAGSVLLKDEITSPSAEQQVQLKIESQKALNLNKPTEKKRHCDVLTGSDDSDDKSPHSSGRQTNKRPSLGSTAIAQQQQSNVAPAPNGANSNSARLVDLGKRLWDASREGQIDLVRQLVSGSGAPFTSDWLGTTALHLAAQGGHTEVANILLNSGVNKDARTKLDRTALHLAAQNGSLGVVDLLLSHRSDINARDMLEMTPLHWAVERRHLRVVERLLLEGADVNVKNKFNLSPLDIAQNSGYFEISSMLIKWDRNGDSSVAKIEPQLHNNFSVKCEFPIELHRISDNQNQFDTTARQMPNEHENIADLDRLIDKSDILADINETCDDFFDWSDFTFEPDIFFVSDEDEDDDDEDDDEDEDDESQIDVDGQADPRNMERMIKIVKELEQENKQLRQKVEQLSTTASPSRSP